MRAVRCVGLTVAGVAVIALAGCDSGPVPRPVGQPDPGQHRLDALTRLRAAVPSSVRVLRSENVEPRWDSCDGRRSTFGWDDVTVEVSFTTDDAPASVLRQVDTALRARGLTPDRSSDSAGQASWTGTTTAGFTVSARLLGGRDAGSAEWDFQLTTPPATRPVIGC